MIISTSNIRFLGSTKAEPSDSTVASRKRITSCGLHKFEFLFVTIVNSMYAVSILEAILWHSERVHSCAAYMARIYHNMREGVSSTSGGVQGYLVSFQAVPQEPVCRAHYTRNSSWRLSVTDDTGAHGWSCSKRCTNIKQMRKICVRKKPFQKRKIANDKNAQTR